MNERDTFNNNVVDLPKYRVDNSRESVYQEEPQKENTVEQNSYSGNLSKTKIININDFIFDQMKKKTYVIDHGMIHSP